MQDDNIAFSFVVTLNCDIKNLDGLTIEIAKTMVEVFKQIYNIHLDIKFPNDIVYQSKKLGGILTQTKLRGEIVEYLVIGIRYKY